MAKGLDIGTMNIICAEKEGEDVVFMQQRNAFMNLDSNDLTKNMLDTSKVLYIEEENGISLLGEDAFKFATIFEKEARRPMSHGIISPKEKEAIPIMKLIVERVLGKPRTKNEVLCVSTPADPIDVDMDVLYHKKTMEALAKGMNYDTHVIDEGLAVIYSELSDYNFTGVGISVGAGMTNVTLAYLGTPLMSFSIGRGGDWIDEQVSKSTGLPKEHVTHTKEKNSKLSKQVKMGSPEGALTIYYEALMTYVIQNLNKRLAKITPPKVAFPVAVAGGSALPEGFFEIFEKKLRESKLRVEISKIKLAKDPLHAVARGCLIAARTQEEGQKTGALTQKKEKEKK
ncbi:MAG: rod shape-determining protein [Thermoplasmatales archaeon]|nr:MAG: rod shape-determining protein [Thermoplasmatales archaeon]